MVGLTPEELERYDRQLRVWGPEAQKKLKSSAVLIVGVGGLGSPAALYLAATGVGRIILVDSEKVELSNLNRQVLHWTPDVGCEKVSSAASKLTQLNPHVEIVQVFGRLEALQQAEQLVAEADVVVDCLDNWKTRFLLNEACVKLGKPLVHAAVKELYGQLMVVKPGESACLRCLLPEDPPEERTTPVAGPTPGVLGALEAMEAVKLITGYGQPLVGKLLIFDGKQGSFDVISVKRREDCPVCGLRKT